MDRRAFLAASLAVWPAMAVAGRGGASPSRLTMFLAAAHEETRHAVTYDPTYTRIPYPMGDVAPDKGVCTDVVIRAYRAIGTDLQRLVHEDMSQHFGLYPKAWGLSHTDSNIDHRRVPNLRVFLARFGASLAVSHKAADYTPGDLVTYNLTGHLPHIAIVSDVKGADANQIIHNIGYGPHQDDALFAWEMTGHYRYAL